MRNYFGLWRGRLLLQMQVLSARQNAAHAVPFFLLRQQLLSPKAKVPPPNTYASSLRPNRALHVHGLRFQDAAPHFAKYD